VAKCDHGLQEIRLCFIIVGSGAGWSSLAARRAHNPKVAGSNPAPATIYTCGGVPGNRDAVCFCASRLQPEASGFQHHPLAATVADDGMRYEARAVARDR